MRRPKIPAEIQASVLAESRRRCCICSGLSRDFSVKAGQIAHLNRRRSDNRPENLAFLCLLHHDEYDSRKSQSKGLTEREVKIYQAELRASFTSGTAWASPEIERARAVPLARVNSIEGYSEVASALALLLPVWQLPTNDHLVGDWRIYFEASTGFPILCRGCFTGAATEEIAFLALSRDKPAASLLVLTESSSGEPQLIQVASFESSPQCMGVSTLPAGRVSIGQSVWSHGGRKSLKLAREGICLTFFESSSCLYYWDEAEERFVEQWLSD